MVASLTALTWVDVTSMKIHPSHFRGDDRPVEQVSWKDAQRFIGKLTSRTGRQYRLLSEAEWEYVARAGTTTKYHWGNVFSASKAVSMETVVGMTETLPVGSYAPNAFGLYDMHGNVWEWVEDCWNKSYTGSPTDGSAWTSGDCNSRVLRGGSWGNGPWELRAAYRLRDGIGMGRNNYYFGFRVARTLSR
jgi:formylglycine-generating enzyme required for sulfatase activity